MQKLNILIIAASTLALASCGATADPNKREPGKWKTVASLENLELTGVPAGMESQVAKMKEQIGAQIKTAGARDECLTAEQAAKEDVSKGLTQGTGGACTFSKETIGGGKIDVAGICKQGGQEMNLALNGTMTPTKIDVLMSMTGKPSAGSAMAMPGMDMKMRIVSTHEGKCTA
jgi:Protein of unknown function (DUF3617)